MSLFCADFSTVNSTYVFFRELAGVDDMGGLAEGLVSAALVVIGFRIHGTIAWVITVEQLN